MLPLIAGYTYREFPGPVQLSTQCMASAGEGVGTGPGLVIHWTLH